jgi:hypothetical protein
LNPRHLAYIYLKLLINLILTPQTILVSAVGTLLALRKIRTVPGTGGILIPLVMTVNLPFARIIKIGGVPMTNYNQETPFMIRRL